MMFIDLNRYNTSKPKKKRKVRGEVYEKYVSPEFKPYVPPRHTAYRETPIYPSVTSASCTTSKVEPKRYTGTLVKGISTMHKSNAVPIIDEREAKEHASMRR